ncbi:MAG TPA: hypothetical protein VGR29_07425 [Thermomicrobiales bacterium]|nr:hypothetical protein [Thermomicrobiales bacterium]
MSRITKSVLVLVLSATMLGSGLTALAQPTPGPSIPVDVETRAQLAAMVPGAEDLPVGYQFVGETFLAADEVASGTLDAGALTSAGFITQYVSVYENPESRSRIRAYVSAWNDASAAEAGFALVEDEAMVAPNAALQDSEAGVGEDPRETTIGTYTLEDGTSVGSVDVTFRRDNLLAGVAVETADGSAADAEMATELATRLDERIETVKNGESPAHTNLELPSQVISLTNQGQVLQAGFLGPAEVENIYGVQGSVLSGIDVSWVESVMVGDPATNASIIAVGTTTFGTPEDAAAAVEQSAELFTPLANQQAVEDVSLEGADAVQAYRYSSENAEGDALDSYRLVFSTGTSLSVIDVQGAGSDIAAAETATQLALAQIACQTGSTCETPNVSAGLGN